MNEKTIARRYAQALYEEAERANRMEEVDGDIALIQSSLSGSRELVRFFESPVIPRDKKESIVKQLFGKRVHPDTLHFLDLLIEKKRESIFPEIVQMYGELRDHHLGIMEAHARVAQPLSEEEEKRLRAALERKTGKRIRLQVEQDPGLIGGLIVRIGDTVYDGSVRHQLVSLREQFAQGTFRTNGN